MIGLKEFIIFYINTYRTSVYRYQKNVLPKRVASAIRRRLSFNAESA